jgi:hypothetical protein
MYRETIPKATLTFKDLANRHILMGTVRLYTKEVAQLYELSYYIPNYNHKKVTLKEALSLLKTNPRVFDSKTLGILYSYIELYDPLVRDKLRTRFVKANEGITCRIDYVQAFLGITRRPLT